MDTIPICLFSEGKRYWHVFCPICDEFERRKKDIWYLTASQDDPVFSYNYKYVHAQFIGEGNRAISKMNLIKASIVVSTTPGLNVFQWKRSKGVKYYVHIPHQSSDITIYRMFGLDFYDAVLLSGQYQIDQIRRLEKIRNIPSKELLLTGIPYMDKLMERIKVKSEVSPQKEKVVLLAPSWGKSSILGLYGSSIIEQLINTGFIIIIRPHPQSFISEAKLINDLMAEFPETEKLKWNRDPDNFDVLNHADILISDFSAVLFDFSLVFNKPIIYTEPNFDKSPYDCSWDEQELWTFETLPKIGKVLNKESFQDVGNLINECLAGSDAEEMARNRDFARQQTWCNIGRGAEKTVDYLLAKYEEICKVDQQEKKINDYHKNKNQKRRGDVKRYKRKKAISE